MEPTDQILIVVAMEAEALPIRRKLGLDGHGRQLSDHSSARIWRNDSICLVTNGINPRFGVDSIGTIPAALTTFSAIKAVEPQIVISAGTCGGFKKRDGSIGEIVIAERCFFHDHRISLGGFEEYGVGNFPVFDLGAVAKRLGFRTGSVSTGDALDAQLSDLERMDEVQAVAKDMEAAAVAWVCEELEVPFTALKVVTDLVDGEEPTASEFKANLEYASERLSEAMFSLVDELKKI